MGIRESAQDLVFDGKQPENGKTISDYEVHDDSTLHLSLHF